MTEQTGTETGATAQDVAAGQQSGQQPTGRDAFINLLPDDLKTDGSLAGFNDVAALAKSYVHARKLIGADASQVLKLPKDDNEESWGAVYSKLGRPEAADKYDASQFKDKLKNAEELSAWNEIFYKSGMTQKQYQAVVGAFLDKSNAVSEQAKQQTEARHIEWQNVLKKEFGPNYDKRIEDAAGAMAKIGGDELAELASENPDIFKHPAMVKMAVKLAELTGESVVTLADGTKTADKLGTLDAQQQINAKMADPTFMAALTNRSHPQHDWAVKERLRLMDMAY